VGEGFAVLIERDDQEVDRAFLARSARAAVAWSDDEVSAFNLDLHLNTLH
jgi:hypothetical protein